MNEAIKGRIEQAVAEKFPSCVVVFDETRGHFIRFRIETADAKTILTNASPDLIASEIEDWDDDQLNQFLLSLCGR